MKAYVRLTGVVFALIVLAHLARLAAEGVQLLLQPVFDLTSLAAVALCAWAWRLSRAPDQV